MGKNSRLIAIGPFKKNLVKYLDYPADFYDDTKEGAIIVTSFGACPSSRTSEELARSCGIKLWDFNSHKLDRAKIDSYCAAAAILGYYDNCPELGKEPEEFINLVEGINVLLDENWDFYFLPEG